MRRLLSLPFVALVALLSVSCLDNSPFVPRIEDTNFDPSLGVDLAASTKTASGLYYRDITVGGGAQVPATGTAAVNTAYQLFLRTGESLQAGNFNFTVGLGQAIAGYDEGMRGMRVGGRRQLILPPNLAYGEQGTDLVPPNAILVYVVDLVAIN